MNIKKNGKIDISKILLGLFSVYFIVFYIFVLQQNKILETDKDGLVHIEYLHSELQRLSKLELENISNDDLIASLDKTVAGLFVNDEKALYFNESPEMLEILKAIQIEWFIYREIVMDFRENQNRDALFLASEYNYDQLENALFEMKIYVNELSESVHVFEIYLIANVVIIGLLLLKILFSTLSELKKNKELSKDLFIDLATGVYNSIKCQEILEIPINPKNPQEVAILIFDLNDLKKTNDLYGHQAGDELIFSFATQLKKASEVFDDEPFIGRYGGDEFVVYLDSTTEEDVQYYIDKVYYCMDCFNETESKQFKISCAVGYSVTTPETKTMTMRELFDVADENMYANKIAMKEKRKQELKAQGIEEPEVKDDRLE